ncbi:sugar-transfer associated ATP-grasp domain-containing protein [Nesterenkonia aerolata]|uniref:Sugar-transfer associated ATP-grasp domain-containing protein n=1 Tax=Nesterenkonia aerolata TaxID=3074079 RepID=A0ABU2DRG2_9MICC|nr:sugar-transfer associated ATP-grasp domain-containing protein [Nesterenkonia sp. LY-0111]MDR8018910.1 sugar-transfer associated ATP-grasp domain-containing protein [Nesterenkonia sp. LY-0111]
MSTAAQKSAPMSLSRRLVRKARQLARRARQDPRLLRQDYRLAKRYAEDYRKFLRKEFRWETSWDQRRPTWWRRGFLSRSVTLYDLEHNDPRDYISDVQRYTRTKYMVHPDLQEILDNKFSFFLLMNQLGLDSDTVSLLGLYSRGAVHVFPHDDRVPLQEFLDARVEVGSRIFIKPVQGAEGRWVRAIRRTPEGYVMNGEPTEVSEIRAWIERLKRPMLFEAAVAQAPEQAALNPQSTNTIRILTMPDLSRGKEPFILTAVQRIGTAQSNHVDNWTQGGLSAEIDVETGTLSRAAQLPEDRTPVWFTHHPDSGARIKGAQVPHWKATKAMILDAAKRLSFMEYVGWDIIISPNGPVILEANINSGMNVLQVHRPLLADPRAREYFLRRGVVRARDLR